MIFKKGFTIVELLIIIAIIAIVSGSALASYNTLAKQQNLTNSAKKLRDVLESAKRKAVAGEGNEICSGLPIPKDTVAGYEVMIQSTVSGTNQYVLNVICKDSGTGILTPTEVATYPFDSGVTIAGVPITVDFAALTGAATFTSSSSPIQMQTDANHRRCISVSSLGVMNEQLNGGC